MLRGSFSSSRSDPSAGPSSSRQRTRVLLGRVEAPELVVPDREEVEALATAGRVSAVDFCWSDGWQRRAGTSTDP